MLLRAGPARGRIGTARRRRLAAQTQPPAPSATLLPLPDETRGAAMRMDRESEGDGARATIRNLIEEAEALLGALGEEGTQRYRDAVADLQRQIRRARDQASDLQYAAGRSVRLAALRADHYAHERPWATAGAAVALGAVVGAVIALLLVHPGGADSDPRD